MGRFTTVREPRLSLWQSAVHQATRELEPARAETIRSATARHVREQFDTGKVSLPGDNTQQLSEDQELAYLSYLHFKLAEALRTGDQTAQNEATTELYINRKYSTANYAGWATCVHQYWGYYGKSGTAQKPQYTTYPSNQISTFSVIPFELQNDATVLLLGDWGTGMPDAVAMLEAALLQLQQAQKLPGAIIHLGDVYYSGTPEECADNVNAVLTKLFAKLNIAPPIPYFAIPGNHEYYSGGAGFYQSLTTVNGTDTNVRQAASFFCLRTQDQMWQFLGMDTGYNDHDPISDYDLRNYLPSSKYAPIGPALQPSEVAWHYDKLNNFGGNTLLLSHHQLFSAFATINSKDTAMLPYMNMALFYTFSPYFDKVAAWFWGHEHNFAAYTDSQFGVAVSRLLGCSAYEETVMETPYTVKYPEVGYPGPAGTGPVGQQVGESPYGSVQTTWVSGLGVTTLPATFYNHAYAVLDFTRQNPGDAITASYYQYQSWGNNPAPTSLPAPQLLGTESISPASQVPPKYVASGNNQIDISTAQHPASKNPPACAYYNGDLYVVYTGQSDPQLLMTQTGPSKQWTGDNNLPAIPTGGTVPASAAGPALCVFKNLLWLYFRGNSKKNVYYCTYDGSNWGGNAQVTVAASNAGPAVAVFGDTLYMAYIDAGTSNNTVCWAWSTDGKAFNGGAQISNCWSEDAPALAAMRSPNFTGLVVAFRGTGNNNVLYYATSTDGQNWTSNQTIQTGGQNIPVDYPPWMMQLGDKLYLIYIGKSNALYSMTFDGQQWSNSSAITIGKNQPQSKKQGSFASLTNALVSVYTSDSLDNLFTMLIT